MFNLIIVLIAVLLTVPLQASEDKSVPVPAEGVRQLEPVSGNLTLATAPKTGEPIISAIPRMLNFQGKLLNALGQPVPD
ncbi:MAG: hypothetical protein ACUVUR_05445, partial [bacterium]